MYERYSVARRIDALKNMMAVEAGEAAPQHDEDGDFVVVVSREAKRIDGVSAATRLRAKRLRWTSRREAWARQAVKAGAVYLAAVRCDDEQLCSQTYVCPRSFRPFELEAYIPPFAVLHPILTSPAK